MFKIKERLVKPVLTEWYYRHVSRKTEKFVPWVARKLPRKLKYYVVIDGMSYISVKITPSEHPDTIKGFDLLELWKRDSK